jgi:A/G-specific adenine glycosylase
MPLPPARRAALRRTLLAWWDEGHRALPWREPRNARVPYRVWLAEVMLQQTQVAAVVPYYERFLARWPTLEALAAAREEEVLALWSGLGYYARGRRLHAAAREALRQHGGLPASRERLAALPGFGPYTAGAVASIAFGERAACVDGNVARVLARALLIAGAPEEKGTRDALWTSAEELVPPERPGDFNQALMELGATVCVKPAPRCARCPWTGLCAARRSGREREIPAARRRREPKELAVACALVERGGAVLVARRPGRGLFAGLWELPSAVVLPGHDPRRVLAAELGSRLGLRLEPGEALAAVERVLTHRLLLLTAYRCRLRGAPGAGARFVPTGALHGLALPTAMRALFRALPLGSAADIDYVARRG